jgi:hypothetical protein
VDYDYVSINNHDYLLPVSAQMRLVKRNSAAIYTTVLNTMEFRDYKRFGSSVRFVDDPEAGQVTEKKPAEGTKPQ